MVKRLICLVLFISIVLVSFVNAADSLTPEEVIKSEAPAAVKGEITSILQNATSKVDENLEKEIQIPWNLEKPARFIFGLKDHELNLQILIVLVSLILIFVIVVHQIVKLMPEIFGEGITALVVTIIISLIGSLSGVLVMLSDLIFNALNLISIMASSNILKLLITLAILIGVFFGGEGLMKTFKHGEEIAKATEEGAKLGFMNAREKAKLKTEEKFEHGAGI